MSKPTVENDKKKDAKDRFPKEGLPIPKNLQNDMEDIHTALFNANNNIASAEQKIFQEKTLISLELKNRQNILKKLMSHAEIIIKSAGYEVPPGAQATYDQKKKRIKLNVPVIKIPMKK